MTYLQAERDAILRAYHEYKTALPKLQESCEHKVLLEADRQSQTYFSDLPAIRICEDCGLEEETQWGSWKKLTGRAYRVSRDQIYRTRPMQTYIPEEDRERLGFNGDVS